MNPWLNQFVVAIPIALPVTNMTMNDSWVVVPRPNPQARLRLICFPYAGGGTFDFRAWPAKLPTDVEVLVIQLPGREARIQEEPHTRVENIVDSIAQALCPYFDRPFAFFGHSLGAIIGFELARKFQRENGPLPVRLFASGARAPQVPNPDPMIHHLPDRELIKEVNERYDGIPDEVLQNAEMVAIFLPALRADFTVNETYFYNEQEPLDCPISAFGGDEDSNTDYDDLTAWEKQTSRDFKLRILPGGHFFIRTAQQRLLHAVTEDLRQSLNGKGLA